MPDSLLIYSDGEIIGDGIIKLPFVAAIRRALPSTRLTWLCAAGKSVYTGSLEELARPLIDEVAFLSSREMPLKDFMSGEELDGRRFDLVIDTQLKVKRTLWLRRRIRHDVFISGSARYLLSDRRPGFGLGWPDRLIDQLMMLGSLAAGQKIFPEPLILTDPKWQQAARALLPDGPRYVGFVPGAGKPNKRWPLERFIAVARHQAEKGLVPVVFLGPMEKDMESGIRAALPTALLPLSAEAVASRGLSGPCLTIALAQRLSAAVANDSGGGHLIAAAGPPMVCLFRSSSVEKKFTPSLSRVIALAPEYFHGTAIEHIPVDSVESALEKLLAG